MFTYSYQIKRSGLGFSWVFCPRVQMSSFHFKVSFYTFYSSFVEFLWLHLIVCDKWVVIFFSFNFRFSQWLKIISGRIFCTLLCVNRWVFYIPVFSVTTWLLDYLFTRFPIYVITWYPWITCSHEINLYCLRAKCPLDYLIIMNHMLYEVVHHC